MAQEITDNKNSRYDSRKISVVTTDGMHLLYMPSGEIIKPIVFTRVYDDGMGDTYVIAKILCNLLEQKDLPDYESLPDRIEELEGKIKRLESKNKNLYNRAKLNDEMYHSNISLMTSSIERLRSRKWYHILFGIK